MPLYDYRCKSDECKYIFEALHKIADPKPSECPKCGHKEVTKLLSAIHGTVELTGNDLKAKTKEDVKKLKHEAANNEKVRANLVGEEKYQENVVAADKYMEDFGKEQAK